MTTALQHKLIEVLNTSIKSIQDIKIFTTASLPSIVQQTLNWYKGYYLILFIISIVLIIIGIYIIYNSATKWKKILFWDKFYDVFDSTNLVFYSPVIAVYTILIVLTFNLQWLQIIIAPKLWILEFISTLH